MLQVSHNLPCPRMKRARRRGRATALAGRAAISITALAPSVSQGPNMARVITIGLAAACAVSLAGCNFIRDDINRSLGHSPEDHGRQADIAASQVTTIGV